MIFRKVIILADNYPQAKEFARDNNIKDEEWIYPNSPEKLRGRGDFLLVRLGGRFNMKHYDEIENIIECLGGKGIGELLKK